MRISIEVDEKLEDSEIIIRCSELNDKIENIQRVLAQVIAKKKEILFYKDNTEYYFPLEEILFFETESTSISAHSGKNVYLVKHKLYELEELLPSHFMRVSKSTILNINHIYSISRNLTSSSIVEFKDTHKKVYVSRHYYKPLKFKLLEKRG